MYGLKTKFHHNGLALITGTEQGDHRSRQAVRPCGDGHHNDVRVGQRLPVQGFQSLYGCIGIGKGLKVGDKAASGLLAAGDKPNPVIDLAGNGDVFPAGKITGAGAASERTSPGIQRAVPGGTGHTAFQSHLIDLFSKAVFQFIVKRVVGPSVPSLPVSHGSGLLLPH